MKKFLVICVLACSSVMSSIAQAQTEAAPAATAIAAAPEYQLGPGDRLTITVFGETELTGEYILAANGNLTFPLVGELPAAGMTPTQLSGAIADRLRGGYLREPRVVSSVIAYRPFYILGEVENPGSYPYAANLDVSSAVAVAGGYTYRANRRRAYIRRVGEAQERRYDLEDAVSIQPGDTIRIGERYF